MGLTTTTVPPQASVFPVTSVLETSGSAEVTSRLVFNSSSPVPSEDLVLSAVNSLRNSRESKLDKSVKLKNVTYEKISDTSYAVIFKFSLTKVSMSNSVEKVLYSTNTALNTLLNEPAIPFDATLSNFTKNEKQIDVLMGHVFNDKDVIKPVSFLKELESQKLSQTKLIEGKAVIRIRILVETLGPIPKENAILGLVYSLLDARFTTKQNGRTEKLGEPVSFQNVSFHRISDHSYALDFGFEINNVSMAENKGNRNNTFKIIKDAINKLLNEILKENSSADKINFDEVDFKNDFAEITADVVYSVSKSNIKAPSKFLFKLFEDITPSRLGTVIIDIRLVFKTRGPIPTESSVLQLANSLLDSRLRTKREVTKLNDPVSSVNVTYTKLSNNSYALNFGFEIINVNMSERLVLRNSTYDLIQDSINKLLNQILNDPKGTPFVFDRAKFTGNTTVIKADVEYVFSDDDIKFPSPFLKELLYVNSDTTTAAPTTTFFPIVVNTTPNNSTSVTWIVAIIVPCAIAIMLIPCWILLCCLLCGCCARLRQRWHRRRSYNVQYTTRNSIF
ncbi:uncharacterized protein LOC130552745 [Triplophysa rosa]|nr:uncharacterized protein LOC130552745 [Triplophysa rosa]